MNTSQRPPGAPAMAVPAITGSSTDPKLFTLPTWLNPYRSTIIACTSSLASTTIGFPLDSIKTRQQTHKYPSVLACVRDTIANEGLKGLYRGLWAPLLSTSASRSLSVGIYTTCKPHLHSFLTAIYTPATTGASLYEVIAKNVPEAFLSGAVAGLCVSTFACPFEFTKLFSQIEQLVVRYNFQSAGKTQSYVPDSTWQVCRRIVSHRGILGLYSGYSFQVVRDAAGSGIYYAVYETIKLMTGTYSESKTASTSSAASVAVSGALAGVICWLVVFPFDTLKSLYQKNIVAEIIRQTYPELKDNPVGSAKKEYAAIRHFSHIFNRRMYRGIGTSVLRTSIVSMTFFSGYEYLSKII